MRVLRVGLTVLLMVVVLAMCPFTPQDTTGPIKRLLLSWGAFALTAICLIGTWTTERRIVRPRLFLWTLLAFLALNLAAALASSHPGHALVEVRRLVVLVLLYFVASQVFTTPDRVRPLLVGVCAATALSTLYAFGQRIGFDPFPWAYTRDAFYADLPGTLGNPNYAAHVLVLCVIAAAYLATHRRWIWCALLVPWFAVHLVLTHHRGGMVALGAAAILTLVAVAVRPVIKRPGRGLATVFALTTLIATLGGVGVMTRANARTGSPLPFEESLYVRYNAYASACAMIRERPLLGFGPGNYRIENMRYWTPFEQERFATEHKMNAHVHNDFLEFAIDAGVPATFLYLLVLLLGMSHGLLRAFGAERTEDRRFGYMAAAFFCAFAVDGVFGFNVRVPASAAFLFVFAGAVDGVASARGNDEGTEKPSQSALLWRWGIVVVAVAVVFIDTRGFLAQMLQFGGTAAMRGGRHEAAERAFAKAEHYTPWNWECAEQRGLTALAAGDAERANLHFRRALALNPQSFMALINLANARMREGLSPRPADDPGAGGMDGRIDALEEAAACARRAGELCPALPEASEIRGRVLFGWAKELEAASATQEIDAAMVAEQWRAAAGYLEQAIELGARTPGPLYAMVAQARLRLGDDEEAECALMEAVDADPTLDSAWALLLRMGEQAGRYAPLEEALNYALYEVSKREPPEPERVAAIQGWLSKTEEARAGEREESAGDRALPGGPGDE